MTTISFAIPIDFLPCDDPPAQPSHAHPPKGASSPNYRREPGCITAWNLYERGESHCARATVAKSKYEGWASTGRCSSLGRSPGPKCSPLVRVLPMQCMSQLCPPSPSSPPPYHFTCPTTHPITFVRRAHEVGLSLGRSLWSLCACVCVWVCMGVCVFKCVVVLDTLS